MTLSPTKSILLKGGTLLVPGREYNSTIAVNKDLLIVGDQIASIEREISQPSELVTVIDCSHKIISLGFINTHHHLWQTQLRGRHADHNVLGYMPSGNLTASFFGPSDVFWGQLGGALEALNSGTTTVVDHAHMNYSEQHSKYALAASMTAGIRSIFCYTPTLCVKSWQPRLTLSLGMLQPWHFDQISQFAALLANHPRISLGFGFDGFAFTPENVIRSLFDKLRAAEVRIITSHLLRTPSDASHKSIIATMAELDILDENTIISHATNATLQDNELLARHGASISCTPSCEMHLGLGQPAIMSQFNQNESRNENLDREIHFSLGCDSHSVVKGSMIEQMRSALFASRMQQTQSLLQKDKFPRAPEPTVEEVFQLATSSGARAIGRENELGRLEVGYKADIVVWDGQGPSMVSAATENPLAAVVCHADAKDIDYVIVDGIIRKQNGNLVDCKMQGYDENLLNEKYFPKKDDLCWVDVAEALEQSHAVLQERLI